MSKNRVKKVVEKPVEKIPEGEIAFFKLAKKGLQSCEVVVDAFISTETV